MMTKDSLKFDQNKPKPEPSYKSDKECWFTVHILGPLAQRDVELGGDVGDVLLRNQQIQVLTVDCHAYLTPS